MVLYGMVEVNRRCGVCSEWAITFRHSSHSPYVAALTEDLSLASKGASASRRREMMSA